MFGRIKKMSMSGKIRKEHKCLKKWDKNSNNWKNKKNSNIWKNNIRIPMFGNKIRILMLQT